MSISDEIGAKYRDRFIRDSDKFIALANSGYFDYILFASTKLELLLDHKPWLNKLNKKNIIGVFCYFNTSLSRNFKLLKITRKMVAVGFITPIQKLIWDAIIKKVPSFIITTGQTPQVSLKENKTKDTIFIGELRSVHHLLKLIDIAKLCSDRKHYLITTRIIDQKDNNKVYLDLLKFPVTDREEEFKKFIESLGYELPENLIFKDIPYGEESEILDEVGIGIDFSWNSVYEIENTKVNRYLTYGLYPIVEMPSPSYRYLNLFQTGKIIDYDSSAEVWSEAINKFESPDLTKINNIRDRARIKFDWLNLAYEIDSIIQARILLNKNKSRIKYRMKFLIRSLLRV
ncbi:MAG: hypothetical protein JJ966_10505 [Balneolaceae bacterium]|nr:hypothetical protein [Balneolaceae bacterium]